jgi:penicillin amidase
VSERRSPLLRLLSRAAMVAAVALAVLGAGSARLYWVWSREALAQVDGEARLPGLRAPVIVRRDAAGVPHIQAETMLDAIRAQGYVTAQDRLWQMDLLRRRALGELSEAFGEGALRADEEVRTLGLGAAARASLPRLDADMRALTEAYAAGVSAYIESRSDALPLEFRLLRYSPRPWTVVDTLATGKLLALDLASGWESEAFRAVVADRLPADVQDLLFPATFPDDRILVGHDAPAPGAAAVAAETAKGSNNWVVSGAHTATGKPLLANDPHLSLGLPSIWTAVHLTAEDLDVAGVTMPGVPGVILGRNRRVAWGATNVHDDCADLYVEEFDPAHPDRYRVGEGWETVVARTESIRVRNRPLGASWRTVDHAVRVTRHGPLVPVRGRLYALRWTSLDGTPDLPAFQLMNRAGRWEEFREALRLFSGPSQNFVYADVDGHIAWYSAGRVPLRRAGDGSRPYRGASADGDWMGLVPFAELPHVVDPPGGRIVTANSRTTGTDYPYHISRGGIPPWRTATLFAALEQRDGWTADDMVRLQGEHLSIPHRDLARALLDAASRHKGDAAWDDVMLELSGWDGRLEPASRPAALAITAFLALGDRVIGPRVQGLPEAEALRHRTAAIDRLIREQPAGWLPTGAADWDAVLRGAWEDACAQLERRLGRDRSRWTCGALNRFVVRHPLSRALPALGYLFNPPEAEVGGASTTPDVFSIGASGNIEAPSMRFVADLADPDDTRLVNFMGQSGQPGSPHYDDQLGPWLRVESQVLPMTAEAVAREARHTLRLVP